MRHFRNVAACLLAAAIGAPAAAVTYLYQLHFDAITGYAAADITFSSTSFGGALTYVSGNIDGFVPGTLNPVYFQDYRIYEDADPNAAANAVAGFYYSNGATISSPGFYTTTGGAGRALADGARGASYRYSSGTLAITATPEPATWGLMVAGFGLLGAALRRRSATALPFA